MLENSAAQKKRRGGAQVVLGRGFIRGEGEGNRDRLRREVTAGSRVQHGCEALMLFAVRVLMRFFTEAMISSFLCGPGSM